jgi:hypothetical protein
VTYNSAGEHGICCPSILIWLAGFLGKLTTQHTGCTCCEASELLFCQGNKNLPLLVSKLVTPVLTD